MKTIDLPKRVRDEQAKRFGFDDVDPANRGGTFQFGDEDFYLLYDKRDDFDDERTPNPTGIECIVVGIVAVAIMLIAICVVGLILFTLWL